MVQLVSAKGVLWTCQQCQADEYVIDSADPRVQCENCPVGADCNNGHFRSLVVGSQWVPDPASGQMRLVHPSSSSSDVLFWMELCGLLAHHGGVCADARRLGRPHR